jgi:hypothetical protein
MNLLQQVKTNLSEILSESTAYGLPKVFKSKRVFFRIYWLAVIILGSIATIYFTVESINSYLKYEKIPKTEIKDENPKIELHVEKPVRWINQTDVITLEGFGSYIFGTEDNKDMMGSIFPFKYFKDANFE